MEFVVGDYRGGRATAVDGVRGGNIGDEKIKKYNTSWP